MYDIYIYIEKKQLIQQNQDLISRNQYAKTPKKHMISWKGWAQWEGGFGRLTSQHGVENFRLSEHKKLETPQNWLVVI